MSRQNTDYGIRRRSELQSIYIFFRITRIPGLVEIQISGALLYLCHLVKLSFTHDRGVFCHDACSVTFISI